MKHKLKRIFNSRMLSRALITVITCSIIFSYAVLCPQAEGSYTFNSLGPYSVLDYEQPYDFLGKDIIPLLDFVPETYLYYSPISVEYAVSDVPDTGIVLNGTWKFSSFDSFYYISSGIYDISFSFTFASDAVIRECNSFEFQVDDNNSILYFIDVFDNRHIVYSDGHYEDIYVYFTDSVVSDEDVLNFLINNFYCFNLPSFFDSMSVYPLSLNFSGYSNDFINISFSLVVPFNLYASFGNIYNFPVDNIYVYDSFYEPNSFVSVPFSIVSTHQYEGEDEFTGVPYFCVTFEYVLDLSSFSDVEKLLFFVPLSTYDTSVVGYSEAAAFISPLTIESFSSVDQAFLNSINNVTNKLEETNATLNNIQNTLTNVTPEMQQSLDSLETLMQDEAGKVEDVINGMDQIGTDFGTEIGDFDNILNENAGTLEDIGSTTYNSFINDVFGNWFFVSMFALFGAFAFFSRAVFG